MFNHYFCQKRQEGTGTRLARAGPKHRPYKKRKTAELRRSSEVLRYKDGGRCSTIIFAKRGKGGTGRVWNYFDRKTKKRARQTPSPLVVTRAPGAENSGAQFCRGN